MTPGNVFPGRLRLTPLPGLLTALVLALGVAPELGAQTRGMRFERLSVEEGLSQGTVNDILQDRQGFLWIATQDGLNRYDGYGFRVYQHDPEDPVSLPGNWILALAEDAAGDIWIGTEGAGLARWRWATDSFDRFAHDPGDPSSLSGDRVVSIQIDRQGDIWLGTVESGLNRLDPANGRFERFPHDPADAAGVGGEYVQTLYEDSGGALWVGTFSGLDRYDRATRSFVHFRHDPGDPSSLSDDRVLSILEDHAGRLWVGTMDGLNRWHAEAGGFVRYAHDPADPESLSQDRIRTLFEDGSERLWVSTDGGLNLLRDVSGRFANFRHDTADPHSLSSDRATSIFQDRGGVLWFGTQGGGVNKWHPATWAFSHFKADPSGTAGLSNPAVYGFSEDADGRIWIATHGGVDVFDRAAGRFEHHRHDPADPASLSDDRVAALLHDRQGTLWVATLASGLNRLDAGSRGFRRYRHDPARPGSLSADAVSSLFEDPEGTLWVGTWGGGLNRLEREADSFVRYLHDPEDPTSLSVDRVTAFAEAEGYLWVGTFGGGLNRLERSSGGFLHLRHDPERPGSLSSDTVFALHVDGSGTLWAGTQGGLNRLESLDGEHAVFRHYLEPDGLPNHTVWGIHPDAEGRLWLSTNGGLSRFDPRAETFVNYDVSHGLQSNEFNFGAHYASRTGELLFGGVNGFNAFFPDRVEPNGHPPPVVLTSLTRFNEPLVTDRPLFDLDEVTLSYRDHFLTFEFAALDFAAPAKNRYRYRLEGFDDGWVELGTERRVAFASIEPGRYLLRVQGANNDGVWNQEGAAVGIVVAPPIWQTWWAYSLFALALAGVTAGFVRHQQRRVERAQRIARRERAQAQDRAALIVELEVKNTELERFNYTVSHDLKSPIVTIKGFLGLLEQDALGGDLQRVKHDIRRIGAATDRMGRLLDELLELSSLGKEARPPAEVPLVEIAAEALEVSRGYAGDRAVEVVIDPRLPVIVGDHLRLRQLYQNLLGNALKYLGEQSAPRVEVGVRHGDGDKGGRARVLFVKDNGKGIDERYREKVFGLFERLDAADEGTGIGLALAKRIVELHGGRIWVESEGPGRGSTFCFTLPGYRAEGDGEQPERPANVVQAGDRFR